MNLLTRRNIARLLLIVFANPLALIQPVWATDTSIYSGFGTAGSGSGSGSGGTSTGTLSGKPNILLLLDTSSSMHIPEPWKEYDPDTYDSHVEYLWNSPAYMDTISTSTSTDTLSTAGSSGGTFLHDGNSNSGSVNGSTMLYDSGWYADPGTGAPGDLKSAVKAYAAGTNTGNAKHTNPAVTDPGPRSTYRKYSFSVDWGSGSTWYDSGHFYLYWVPLEGRAATDASVEADPRLRSVSPTKFMGATMINEMFSQTPGTFPVNRGGMLFGPTEAWGGWPYVDYISRNKCKSSHAALIPSTIYAPSTVPRNAGKALNQHWLRWERISGLDDSRVTNFPGAETITTVGAANFYQSYLDGKRTVNQAATDYYSYPVRTRIRNGATGADWTGAPVLETDSYPRWANMKPDYGGYHYIDRVGAINKDVLNSILQVAGQPAQATEDLARQAFKRLYALPEYWGRPGPIYVTKTRACNYTGYSYRRDIWGYDHYTGGTCSDGGTSCDGTAAECAALNPPACSLDNSYYQQYYLEDTRGCSWASGETCGWSGRGHVTQEGGIGSFYHGGTCGQLRGGSPVGGTSSCCQKEVQYSSTVSGGTTYYDVRTDNATEGCYRPVVESTCTAQMGSVCKSCAYQYANVATSRMVFDFDNGGPEWMLFHDCKEDEGTANNPGSSYMRKRPVAEFGAWDGAWAGIWYRESVAELETDWGASYDSSYTNNTAKTVPLTSVPPTNIYSVNYLNFKFGAKACRKADGSLITSATDLANAASCKPIGRKTRLQIAKDVLTDLINDLVANNTQVNLGLMVFADKNASTGRTSGSYVVKKIQALTATTGAALVNAINNLGANSDTPLTEALYEAYQYYRGGTRMFGVDSNVSSARRDTSAETGSSYISPMDEGGCQQNLVVMISDGSPEDDHEADAAIKALPTQGAYSIVQATTSTQLEVSSGVPYGPPDPSATALPAVDRYVWLDELANYMAHTDASSTKAGTQTIKLNTISFAGPQAPVMDRAAVLGGGSAFRAVDAASLKSALSNAVVGAAKWQPIGNVTVTYNINEGKSDDVYVPMFNPGSDSVWPGTVKRFKYGFGEETCGPASCGNPDVCLTGQTEVDGTCKKNVEFLYEDKDRLDEYGQPIVFRKIRDNAVSYWGNGSLLDGGSATKGGTGQMLISGTSPANPNARKLYTFFTNGVSNNDQLNTGRNQVKTSNSLITKELLGVSTDAEKDTLVDFATGGDGTGSNLWRAWAHFDSVHSRVVVDQAGTPTDTTDDTLYYLTSDGVLHAVDATSGQENWAFMVEEAFPYLKTLKNPGTGDHLEIADGAPVVVKVPDSPRERTLVVFGLRRGGRAYYALDVSTANTPKFLWKISNTSVCSGTNACSATTGSCTTGAENACYQELGQAWSTPAVSTIRQHNVTVGGVSKPAPVLIFGGGYDTAEDATTQPTSDTMGRAVFVVDAATGALMRRFNLLTGSTGFAVPSEVLAVDTNGDTNHTVDRIYVGDLGGNVWRMDTDGSNATNDPTSWQAPVKLAKLASSGTGRSKKIFYRPSMAPITYSGQIFDAVWIGTGDTQQPLDATLSGSFFMIKDFYVNKLPPTTLTAADINVAGDFVDMTSKTTADALTTVTDAGTGKTLKDDLKAAKGWVVQLSGGEKITSNPLVLAGKAYVGTYFPAQPASGTSCGATEGYGRQMVMDALTAMPLFVGTTLVNSAGNGRVFAAVYGMGVAPNIIGNKSGSGTFVGTPGTPASKVSQGAVKTYWYSVPEK